ncbi:MAG: hypothetical protein LBU16_10470 [Treponema sp.]|jgi:hypothetical protein|nr:hypothetical protein [Treponema sp.]
MTHTTRYETRDEKTRRVNDTPPQAAGTAKPAAAPKSGGADNNQPAAQPAKQGA